MTFYYSAFNGINLPEGVPSSTVNLVASSNIQPMKEGAIDLDAGTRTRHQGQAIQHSGLLSGKDTLEFQSNQLRVKYGFSGQLERKQINSRVVQWTDAKLNSISPEPTTLQSTNRQQVSMSFTQLSPVWYGLSQRVVTDTLLTNGQSIIVTNNGNAEITNPIVTLTLGLAFVDTLTDITITIPGRVSITFTGSFVANDVLVFNAGNIKFTQNGVFPSGFNLSRSTTLHKTRAWIDLLPGDNELIFSTTPSIPTITNILSGMYTGSLSPATYSKDFIISDNAIVVSITFFDGWE